ncbi:MAG: FxsA family protein [Pseudobdellovibrionaceae bacterium]
MVFLFFFLVVPVAEIYVLYQAAATWGFWNAFFLQVLVSGLGFTIARSQFQTFITGFQNEIQKGKLPEAAMFHVGFKFVGGVFLAVPGFLTDILGLAFLTPGIRHLLIAGFQKKVANNMKNGHLRVFTFGSGPFGGGFKSYSYSRQFEREERDAQVVDVTPISTQTSAKNIEGPKDPKET